MNTDTPFVFHVGVGVSEEEAECGSRLGTIYSEVLARGLGSSQASCCLSVP